MTQIYARITNLAGADVHVMRDPDSGAAGWICTGCHDGKDPDGWNLALDSARIEATQHADTCRFKPAD